MLVGFELGEFPSGVFATPAGRIRQPEKSKKSQKS
jgi:hypothetical protein